MTSPPVTQQDIVSAATVWLLSKPDVTSAVGMFNIDGRVVPGIFAYRLWLPDGIEGTSSAAAVVSSDGGWTSANLHNTLRFPRLMLSVFVDPIRDAGLNATSPGEAQRRTNAVFEVIDRHLHHVQGNDMLWGDLRVISCVRMAEPVTSVVADGDGVVRLQVYYAVTQG